MWYQKSFRRHLCDMHIDDWDASFLSKLDPDVYVQNLKTARIRSAMLYFQSHVGLCYYPTKSGRMHRGLIGRENLMQDLVKKCRREGIFVTGYYSLIYNTWAHDTYPEWRMLSETGISKRCELGGEVEEMGFSGSGKAVRYGFCCPNNPDYRSFTETQIREMADYFTVDGMFYDMLFWPHMCYCEHCRARWEREVGGEIPTCEDWSDARWLLHMKKRREWMGEFAQWITDLTHSLFGNVSVEHNVAYSAKASGKTANAEEVIAACDYAGGDLYDGIYVQSFACKFYQSISKHQPFEYMFSRCAPALSAHTQIKSKQIMESTVFLTSAHHGASLVIDAIDPVGTMDSRVYERLREVFEESAPYERYLCGTPITDVGIYYSLKSKFNAHGEPYTNYAGSIGAVETMIREHVLCGVTGGFAKLDPHRLIVASCLTEEDAYDAERLVAYVKQGGNLYFSGGDCKSLLRAFFDAETVGRTVESVTYLAPRTDRTSSMSYFNETYPMHFDGTAPIVEGIAESEVLATVTLPYTGQGIQKFASIHSNPPAYKTDMPAIACKKYGKGTVLWSAFPIECAALYDAKEVFLNLLRDHLQISPCLMSDAGDDIEMTAFRDGNRLLIHAVLLNTKPRARRVENFEIAYRCSRKPACVLRAPQETPIDFSYQNGILRFSVDQMRIFDTYIIEF